MATLLSPRTPLNTLQNPPFPIFFFPTLRSSCCEDLDSKKFTSRSTLSLEGEKVDFGRDFLGFVKKFNATLKYRVVFIVSSKVK